MNCQTVLEYLFAPAEKSRQVAIGTEKGFRKFWTDALECGTCIPQSPYYLSKTEAIFAESCDHLSGNAYESMEGCIIIRPISNGAYICKLELLWGVYRGASITQTASVAHLVIFKQTPADGN